MTYYVEELLNKNDMLCPVLIVESTMVVDFKGLKEVALTHTVIKIFNNKIRSYVWREMWGKYF